MKVVDRSDENGKVVYNSGILNPIVRRAAEDVEGVVKYSPNTSKVSKRYKNGVKIETVGDYVYIDIYLKLYHFAKVKEVAYKVQESVRNMVESMTDYIIKDINVHVVDVEFTSMYISPTSEEEK